MNKTIYVTAVAFLVLVMLLLSCSTPAPAPTSAVPSPVPTTSPQPAAPADPLTQIIEGAKKEGAVTISMTTPYTTVERVQALKKAIKDKYNVDLDIKEVSASNMSALISDAILEQKSGAKPTYDMNMLGHDLVPDGMRAGIYERVDWAPLVKNAPSPEAIPTHPDLKGGVMIVSEMTGLMYNPQKVQKAELPKSIHDLADPKWKSRIGTLSYTAYWARWAFMLGKEKTYATLRGIMKNNAMALLMPDLNQKFLLGDVQACFIAGTYMRDNVAKGAQAAWQNLDMLEFREFHLVVRNGATHPNAAKLIAAFLASPDGVQFSTQVALQSYPYFAGNPAYDAAQEAKKAGISLVTLSNTPKLLDFVVSPQYAEWQKEIDLIFKGG